jgi:hypothetical protein
LPLLIKPLLDQLVNERNKLVDILPLRVLPLKALNDAVSRGLGANLWLLLRSYVSAYLLFLIARNELLDPLVLKLSSWALRLLDIPEGLMDSWFIESRWVCFLFSYSLNKWVELVLDLILGPTFDVLWDHGPLISDLLLFFQEDEFLSPGPRITLDIRTEEVDPSLSALLPLSPRIAVILVNFFSDILPLLLSGLLNETSENVVLIDGPRQLLRHWLVLGLPFVVALVVITPRNQLRDP